MGKVYEKLIKHDIAVYISHTNLDVSEGGMNDWMAEALGIENTSPIHDMHNEQLSKLVVFVPKSHHQEVLDAVLGAGAGWIGNYSHCSVSEGGMNDWMAEALGIENTSPIHDMHNEQLSKLVVFVPKSHHQRCWMPFRCRLDRKLQPLQFQH